MATARDLITQSLKGIGVIAAGETPTASEMSDSLDVLNDMIDGWSAEGLTIFKRTREEFDLVGGQTAYTFGGGGDFDSARPQVIRKVTTKQSDGQVELPVRIYTTEEWANIVLKGSESTIPTGIYYDNNYPLATVSVYPSPSQTSKLIFYTLKPLTSLASADTELSFPPGYKKALKLNLRVDLGEEFGRPVSQRVEMQAIETKANLMRMNHEPALLTSDAIGLTNERHFNIFRGDFD